MDSNTDLLGHTSNKEVMRGKIRSVLGSKPLVPMNSAELSEVSLPPIPKELLVQEFTQRFRQAGGKCKLCANPQDLAFYAATLLKNQKYRQIFCNSEFLKDALAQHGVTVSMAQTPELEPEVIVVYADVLVAREGSFGFTQAFSRYPSNRNVAPDFLIVATSSRIVSDLNDALELLERENSESKQGLLEFLKPQLADVLDGRDVFSKKNSRMILLLGQ